MKSVRIGRVLVLILCSHVLGCGGGGGGGSSANGGAWDVRAGVVSDSCGERLSAVRQTFNVTISGGDVVIDSSAISLSGTTSGDGFSASFSEANGNCTRRYEAVFSGTSSDAATATLKAVSTCDGNTCSTEWSGTATRIG